MRPGWSRENIFRNSCYRYVTPLGSWVNSQISRFPDSQIPKFPDSQISRFPDSQIPRFSDFQIPKFPDSQIPQFPDSPPKAQSCTTAIRARIEADSPQGCGPRKHSGGADRGLEADSLTLPPSSKAKDFQ
jgi:hypothetical protein